MSRKRRIGRAVSVGSLAVLVAGVLDTSSAAAAPDAFGIPPAPDNSYTSAYDFSANARATITKLRTAVDVPNATYLSYVRLCAEIAQSGSDDPDQCPEIKPPTTSFDDPSSPVWIQASGPIWVSSPAGAARKFGSYAPVRVNGSFGGKAISATVHLSQPVRDGVVTPFQLSLLTTASPVPAEGGTVNARGAYPAVTIPANAGNSYLVEQATIRGPLDVRISDVKVAGRPIAVGNACRTSSAARIELGSPAGAYDASSSASSLRGRPGGFQPLSSDDPGSVQGNVAIPSFTGCRNSGYDVSGLVTALISGSRNAAEFNLTRPLSDCSNPNRDQDCPAYPSAAKQTGTR